MSVFRDKVLLIVNTASLCGFTSQYLQLEELYQKYLDRGFVVLGFPCNQFAGEDPLPIKQIITNMRKRFKVTFPIMDKVIVNGEGGDAMYQFLKAQRPGKLGFKGVRWNFEKFLVDRDGTVLFRYESAIEPRQFEPRIIQTLDS